MISRRAKKTDFKTDASSGKDIFAYVAFGLNFPIHFLHTWKHQFPWLQKFIHKTNVQNSVALGKTTFVMTEEIKELIIRIINCSYTGTIRKLYLKTKTEELVLLTFYTMTEGYIRQSLAIRPGDIEKMNAARDYLIQHTDKKITITQLAAITGINSMKLKQLFRQQHSVTIHSFHLDERLKKACELLCDTDLEIGEIAKITGFSSLAHFTMAFHKGLGLRLRLERGIKLQILDSRIQKFSMLLFFEAVSVMIKIQFCLFHSFAAISSRSSKPSMSSSIS